MTEKQRTVILDLIVMLHVCVYNFILALLSVSVLQNCCADVNTKIICIIESIIMYFIIRKWSVTVLYFEVFCIKWYVVLWLVFYPAS
jgi:hypothetical protein